MIIIGLGSNLISNIGNNPQKNCQLALEKMREVNIFPIKVSSFFESAPLPVSTQPWFVNLAVSVKTDLDPHKLLNVLLSIESEMGRKRGGKNAPRVIDLDILAETLKENPEVMIELKSHTDFVGTYTQNMVLSQQRADVCIAYLISQYFDVWFYSYIRNYTSQKYLWLICSNNFLHGGIVKRSEHLFTLY